ncbi:unnamed protein product [Clavelina lepadiformis]|uniref:Uncharacterized protein n=1 Tax=Clavelina lepadiformis TaxID=159417 RepID=A0ABP0G502_CLALP
MEDKGGEILRLRNLSQTRWTTRGSAAEEDLGVLKNLHQCLINAANAEGLSTEIKKTLSPLSSLLDLDALTKECLKLPVHVKIYNKEGSFPIRRVTQVSTIYNGMARESSKKCLLEIHR